MDTTTQRMTQPRRTDREWIAHARDEVCVVIMPHGAQPVSSGEAECHAERVVETSDERGSVCEPMS